MLDNCLKRRPEQASKISKETVLGFADSNDELPPALESLARDINKPREKTPMDLEIEAFLNRPAQQRQEDIPIDKSADTDVSFLFADYKESNETLQSNESNVGCDNKAFDLDTPNDTEV
jgi:hypothetical protein